MKRTVTTACGANLKQALQVANSASDTLEKPGECASTKDVLEDDINPAWLFLPPPCSAFIAYYSALLRLPIYCLYSQAPRLCVFPEGGDLHLTEKGQTAICPQGSP
jgi:hypothetical protein